MPTAAKLFSAICLAVLAYVVSDMIKATMPPNTQFGYFSEVNVIVGLVCGWVVVGDRAGRGVFAGIANGATGVAAFVFWALFVHACYGMFEKSLDRKYGDVIEAITGIFEIGLEYSQYLLHPPILTALLVGAIVTGLVSEYAARHWR